MAPVRNGRHLFNQIPLGNPIPGQTTVYDDTQLIDVDTVPLNGGFLVKTLVLAIDPYLRALMTPLLDYQDTVRPFKIGEPLSNYGIGVVLRSEYPEVKSGDHVYGIIPFQEYSVLDDFEHPIERMRVLENKLGLPWSTYLGAAEMPGQTSYMAWKEYAKAKPGDVVFVTAGSGVVGSLVIQIAKREGLKVISCASSEEKLQYLRDIGTDVAFNYKTTNMQEVLAKEGPVDIYWDNVGGEALNAALDNANNGARFLMCGWMAAHNSEQPHVKSLYKMIGKQITMQGFLVWALYPKYLDRFYQEFVPLLASGEIKHREDVTHGLDKVGDVLLDVQLGRNFGKAIVHVADG